MCASLHKAQLLGGVKRQPPDRGTLGTAVLGASGFLGVGNLNLSCLCWVSNMAVTNDHSKSVLACALCSTCLKQQGCVTDKSLIYV